jgi:hypothetical protein
MDEGWSASSGLRRLILDSAGRLAGFVSPEAWDDWVSELEIDSRNLLPGYSLTQSTGRYLRLDKAGRTVADVDRRAWKERREIWAAAGGTVHQAVSVVCAWNGRRKEAVFERGDWKQAKSRWTRALGAHMPSLSFVLLEAGHLTEFDNFRSNWRQFSASENIDKPSELKFFAESVHIEHLYTVT